jgi:indole-3-glycerol phosphate synthase
MTFLDEIVRQKRLKLKDLKEKTPIAEIEAAIGHQEKAYLQKRPFFEPFSERSNGEVRVIAELKQASPSRGEFHWHLSFEEMIDAYTEGGAYAISVITEESHFHGDIKSIMAAKERTNLPILRKDFIVDAYEIYESKALGADAVLLIGEALEEKELKDMLSIAKGIDIDVLLEIHSLKTYEKIAGLNGFVLGINNRDLRSLKVDITTANKLLEELPKDLPVIIESGIETRHDILGFLEKGVSGFLIGTALVASEDPVKKLYELRGIGGG